MPPPAPMSEHDRAKLPQSGNDESLFLWAAHRRKTRGLQHHEVRPNVYSGVFVVPMVGAVQVQNKIDELTKLDGILYEAGKKEFEKVRVRTGATALSFAIN